MKLPDYLARQLRRLAGPDPMLVQRLLETQARAGQELDRRVKAGQRNHELQEEIDRLRAKLAKAINVEPGPVEGCTKVRLRDQDEAWAFAARVSEDSGQPLDRFKVYPCPICPRQPIGVSRFLHITNRQNEEQRSQSRISNAGKRNVSGRALGDRIDPSVLEKFRKP